MQSKAHNSPKLNAISRASLSPDNLAVFEEKQNARRNDMDLRKAELIRKERNKLLLLSDYTQLVDAPKSINKAMWSAYRQALRDLPTNANFPNLEKADWPKAP